MTTESPRAAVLSDERIRELFERWFEQIQGARPSRWAGVSPLAGEYMNVVAETAWTAWEAAARAIIKADREARAVDAGSEPLTAEAVVQWIRNNYQDYLSVGSLTDALREHFMAGSDPATGSDERPQGTAANTTPAAAGAAPQAMPADTFASTLDGRPIPFAATQPAGEAQGADEPRGGWRHLLDCVIDIYLDEVNHAPEHRTYVEGSFSAIIEEARAALARPAAGAGEGLTEDARDAARYRWLRDTSVPPHNFYISVPDEFHGVRYTAAEVDAGIDAAIAALSTRTAQGGQE